MEATAAKKSNHGLNVRRWREWRGVNQEMLAEKIGISQATLSVYEKKEKLEQDILARIAKALDVPLEAITDIEESTAINIINAHDNQSVVNHYPTFNPVDKIIELFERMLREKDEKILLLEELLKCRK